ncbi:NAD-dependent protein deacylase [Gordonia sinesedis]
MTGVQPTMIGQEAIDALRAAQWVTVFTGAGMSADSGIPTFRDVDTGLWERYDPAELATPEAWRSDPALVWAWYLWRAHMVRAAQPNAGHLALADLAADRALMVVTQNVDDLHERAGTPVVAHLHGSLFEPRCANCGHPYTGTDADPDRATGAMRVEPPTCPVCLSPIRPGVVWFGEALDGETWQRAESAFAGADLVLVVGTSGIVYPAAGLPERAAARGVPVIEINPEPSGLTRVATHSVRASAAVGLPALVAALRQPETE